MRVGAAPSTRSDRTRAERPAVLRLPVTATPPLKLEFRSSKRRFSLPPPPPPPGSVMSTLSLGIRGVDSAVIPLHRRLRLRLRNQLHLNMNSSLNLNLTFEASIERCYYTLPPTPPGSGMTTPQLEIRTVGPALLSPPPRRPLRLRLLHQLNVHFNMDLKLNSKLFLEALFQR